MRQPNILFIMTDDHAAHAIGAYGSRINRTPNIDRIAATGVRCDSTFCTNSICAPSRACIMTGTYNHVNGVRCLHDRFDGRQDVVSRRLQQAGYQTAIIGKWHLGHGGESDPTGFDHWCVLPHQGKYFDPEFLTAKGKVKISGYVTDLITDMSLDWLAKRDPAKPFFLMMHHKAPHREWECHPRHAHLYPEGTIPEPAPESFWDDHSGHARAAQEARMKLEHLRPSDLGQPVPAGMSYEDEHRWRYQHYLARYLRTVQAVDDSVGRTLDWLEANGLREDTIVVYTSDQGFFLGDHGWFDKRFMYEESLRMPFLVSAPGRLPQGAVNDDILLNVDMPATFLEWAGQPVPTAWQGRSFDACLQGRAPADWRQAFYYRYWMHKDNVHDVWAHYGVRTRHHKLIHYYADLLDTDPDGMGSYDRETPEWELFDLRKDPREIHSVADDPDYGAIRAQLTDTLHALQAAVGDRRWDEAESARCIAAVRARAEAERARSIGEWQLTGPFVFAPGAVTLDTATPVEADLVAGRPVRPPTGVRQLRVEAGAKGLVDLDKAIGHHEHAICYAVAEWHEPAAREVELGIGSDDGVRVWLDGREIHANDVQRGFEIGQDKVRVRLSAGPHRLVLKIVNYLQGWGFGVVRPPA